MKLTSTSADYPHHIFKPQGKPCQTMMFCHRDINITVRFQRILLESRDLRFELGDLAHGLRKLRLGHLRAPIRSSEGNRGRRPLAQVR